MEVCSIEWLSGLLLLSAVFFHFPSLGLRQAVLAACSLGFLAAQTPGLPGWITLIVFLSTGYLATRLLIASPSRAIFYGYLLLLVAGFVIIKQYAFVHIILPESFLPRTLAVVGISYMLFRQIHLAVDALQGQIVNFTFWSYLNYQLNLFGLVAGPIQRYQEFLQYWCQLVPVIPDLNGLLKTYLRIFIGIIKILALAPPCLAGFGMALEDFGSSTTALQSLGRFMLLIYLYPAYLYFNFSGYCDMVIGGASLVGIRMPENFNYPFLSRNLSDLWTRWHRTLGFWIRDYLFTPIFKTTVEQWPRLATPLSLFSFLTAFSLAGVWHGSTSNFLIFGLLNGVGVSIAKLWEMLLLKRGGRIGLKKYLQSNFFRTLAIILTIHYFSFTLLFFSSDLAKCLALLQQLSTALAP